MLGKSTATGMRFFRPRMSSIVSLILGADLHAAQLTIVILCLQRVEAAIPHLVRIASCKKDGSRRHTGHQISLPCAVNQAFNSGSVMA
jgi:hypothetical protein